jgi:DNA adenine methylase
MGSKARIAKDILPIILKDREEGQWYVEPFVGGCNIIDKVKGKRLASDANKYLIALWKGLQENKERPYKIDKAFYSQLRDQFNGKIDSVYSDFTVGWVGFMGSYNGRFFDGGYSGHKVGKRDYISEQIRNTEKQIDAIQDIEFVYSNSYKDMNMPKNSIVYCDIPYKNTKQYLTSKNFNHDEFWQWCRDMSKQGHKVFISEYNAPSDFKCIWEKEITNAMNTIKTYKPTEKLFIHEEDSK